MSEDIELENEEEIEDNYEVTIFVKDIGRYKDCVSFYADDENEALEMAKKKFVDKYPLDEYEYRVEYIGSLESDRGYEMQVERGMY